MRHVNNLKFLYDNEREKMIPNELDHWFAFWLNLASDLMVSKLLLNIYYSRVMAKSTMELKGSLMKMNLFPSLLTRIVIVFLSLN